jgi:hypothetical protein
VDEQVFSFWEGVVLLCIVSSPVLIAGLIIQAALVSVFAPEWSVLVKVLFIIGSVVLTGLFMFRLLGLGDMLVPQSLVPRWLPFPLALMFGTGISWLMLARLRKGRNGVPG